MGEEKSSYRQIFKATSIFGGVQIFNIFISIVRSKIIAILLGPVGIGIADLFTSAINLIAGLTNFGLGSSAVKNVAEAYNTNNSKKIALTVTTLRKLVVLTGLLGTIITIIFSPWLSKVTFGSRDYTLTFILLSVTLFINQISVGQKVIMQGFRQINYLAISSLLGSFLSLIFSIPLYYIWRLDGIGYSLIITSIITLLVSLYYSNKTKIEKIEFDKKSFTVEGKEMLFMGFLISLSSLYVLAKNYGIRIFIGNLDGLEQVGFYTAGFAILNTYVGMIFTAMAADYYPRLSTLAKNNQESKVLINQQAEVAILILAPITIIFITFIGWIIVLLYSKTFLAINEMVQWGAIGMFFKASSWSIAFIFLAKGDKKLYIFNELLGGSVTLFFHLAGYYLGGLKGIGIGFTLGYLYYTIQVYVIAKNRYSFNFNTEFLRIFSIQFIIAVLCFAIVAIFQNPWNYILGGFFAICSLTYSFNELEKRLKIKHIITSKFLK